MGGDGIFCQQRQCVRQIGTAHNFAQRLQGLSKREKNPHMNRVDDPGSATPPIANAARAPLALPRTH